MRLFKYFVPLLLLTTISAQTGPNPTELVTLTQASPRAHPKLTIPKHDVGPTVPGLEEGAIPQGLVYWKKRNWFLISHYFENQSKASVLTAVNAATGKLERCLTLVEDDGNLHTGHVGGVAVSDKYVWIGSGKLYRAPMAAVEEAKPLDFLKMQPPIETECWASFVGYHNKKVWVGEFVSRENDIDGRPEHKLKDRKGVEKYAWIAGYTLNADENMDGTAGNKQPLPTAIISIRQKVQGMAFIGNSIVLSMSYGRKNSSTLASYRNPLSESQHRTVHVGGRKVPLWFADGENSEWEKNYPPMSEGICAYDKRFAVVFESGAQKYQKGGLGPIDTILLFNP